MSNKFGRWQADRQVIPDLAKQKRMDIYRNTEENQQEANLEKSEELEQQLALNESLQRESDLQKPGGLRWAIASANDEGK